MARLKCHVSTYNGTYDVDFKQEFIDRVKSAGHISSQESGFRIHFEYRDEDGHHKISEPVDISSWDDLDKIACTVLAYIYAEHGGFDYSTLELLKITGQGKVMGFNEKTLMKITSDMYVERQRILQEEEEKKELARLQAKYKKAC